MIVNFDHRAEVAAIQAVFDHCRTPRWYRAGSKGVAVADEIDALAARTRIALDDLFNFGAHNDLIWKDFEVLVRMGYTLKARIVETRTEVKEEDAIN